jgi:oxygen-independent coproporphyrinogen-3 oxidase
VLEASDRRVERVMLELRLDSGLPLDVLTDSERRRVPALVASGLAVQNSGRLQVTLRGRLLADAVIRDLLD